ncbi:MAG: transcription elongation factor, partial [Desulfurococcales archaeon ex4484_58]
MKYPLDKICVRSGVFCPSCQRKLDSGLVDHSEVDVMKALMELEDRLKELRKGEYVKSYTIDDVVVIILRNGWERRELETIARETAYKLRKKVKIALDTGDRKRLVEQVVSP